MKLLNVFKNLLGLENRVLDLEVDNQVKKWTLEKFYNAFQYNHLSELSELKVRIFIRLLREQGIFVAFASSFVFPKPMVYELLRRTLFLDHKNICVGDILDYLQHCNAITKMKRRKEDTDNGKNKETVETSA